MTSLSLPEVARKVEDPAMSNTTGPMLVDASSEYESFNLYNTQTAPVIGTGGDPPAYNGIEVKFIHMIEPGVRVRLDKSYIKVDYYAANMVNPLVPVGVNTTHVSIPWNTAAAMLSMASFILNNESRSVERYDSEFGHGNMLQVLTSYTQEALETAHDKFFTPCIEETRDLTTGLSVASQTRCARWLGGMMRGSKSIMLSDIFDSMKVPSAWLTQKLELTFGFKRATEILIRDAAPPASVDNLYVIGVSMYLCTNKLSGEQINADSALLQSGSPVMINAYRRFEATTTPANATITYEMPAVKNLQGAVAMFSSRQCADGLGVNPYQYCYGSGVVPNTGVTDYQQRYGIYYSPLNVVNVSRVDKTSNTNLMANWRLLARTINEKTTASPVTFFPCMGVSSAGTDPNNYVFFTAIFCNQDTAPKKQLAGMTHIINIHGAATGQMMHIVRVRMAALTIGGDLSVQVLE